MGRQAVVTKYHGPRGRLQARISASAKAGRVYLPYDHAANLEANHRAAARALIDKYKWAGMWFSGYLPDERMVFVARNSFPEDTFVTDGAHVTDGAQ